MTAMNFTRARAKQRHTASEHGRPRTEIITEASQQTTHIIKGMGKGRYSPAAGQYMGQEPAKRIDPNSAEGRAIAARLGLPP